VNRNRIRLAAALLLACLAPARAAGPAETVLLVRADDIGSSHAANLACIESYRNGIVRSVELMVPCAWFTEAVALLAENPGLDVGVHLTLTSEWENVKWRPLTAAPSLVDSNGFFFPMVWPNPSLPPHTCLLESAWKLDEVERELRGQIELALKHVPRVSHLSSHMAWTHADPALGALYRKLEAEYGLSLPGEEGLGPLPGFKKGSSADETVARFVEALKNLGPGRYLFVEHPGLNVPEMRATGHKGYENVAEDRAAVTRMFTDPAVRETVKARGIRLIGYDALKEPAGPGR
jgi:hypothetical protein